MKITKEDIEIADAFILTLVVLTTDVKEINNQTGVN